MICEQCNKELTEVWHVFNGEDYCHEGLVGYECKFCDYRIDLNGEVF